MTREEEIKKQAEKKALEPSRLIHPYAKQYKVMSAYEIGYIEGAVWADAHPHWISVEDELPPIGGIVLVAIPFGGELSVLPLSIKNEKDLECLLGMTHWMPLPQLPEGSEQ